MVGTAANPVQMIQALLRDKRFAEAETAAAKLARQLGGPKTAVCRPRSRPSRSAPRRR